MNNISEIKELVNSYCPIGLEEMDNVRLMDRMDTKYVLPVWKLADLIKMMKDDYRVLEINGIRNSSYDTTYFDTEDHLFFMQHVTGKAERYKVRFRKYNSTGVTFFEVKKKTNKGRTIKWRIEKDIIDDHLDEQDSAFVERHIPDNPRNLMKVLSNHFCRITMVGIKVPERITLDYNLSYSGINPEMSDLNFISIAELKSNGIPQRSPFSHLIKKLCIYPVGFSKYCIGNALLYDMPKKNILKPKLLLLNKIRNEYNRSVES